MEPITLCGLVIVVFGLWVEFEPAIKSFVKMICKSKFFTDVLSNSEVQRPVYGRRMPICVAKGIGN
jgi:hypothetical protein